MNHQNPERSEIEKRKILGNIMKFQNLKLEKEREIEESKKQKWQSIEKKESTFGTVGYEQRWQWATIAWEWLPSWQWATILLQHWATIASEWVSEFERAERKGDRVSVFELGFCN